MYVSLHDGKNKSFDIKKVKLTNLLKIKLYQSTLNTILLLKLGAYL